MKNNTLKFLIRLFIVVLGVLISFSIEKKRALSYKEDLKNHSLKKMLDNINHDLRDKIINYEIHTNAWRCCDRLLDNSEELFQENKDSLGYYIQIGSMANTIFIDNKEEYLTLRNSGLFRKVKLVVCKKSNISSIVWEITWCNCSNSKLNSQTSSLKIN